TRPPKPRAPPPKPRGFFPRGGLPPPFPGRRSLPPPTTRAPGAAPAHIRRAHGLRRRDRRRAIPRRARRGPPSEQRSTLMTSPKAPATLGELKASGWRSRSVRAEGRDHLDAKLE